jgi:hypothetical protein
MAYDTVSETVLLFKSGTLYSYNGSVWRMISGGHLVNDGAMAHDRDRGVTVLCGKVGATYQTWEWDGSEWEQIPGFTPAVYSRTSFVYDENAKAIRTFAAGLSDNPPVRATWEYADQTWRLVLEEDFAPVNSGLVFDRDLGVVLSFGGSVSLGTDIEQHWTGNRWEDVEPEPSARYGGAMAYDEARGHVVLFGGLQYPVSFPNDTWLFEDGRWRNVVTKSAPPPGYGYAHAFDKSRGILVVAGGYNFQNFSQETWFWDGSDWTEAGPAPVVGWSIPPLYYDDSIEMVVMGTDGFGTFGFDGTLWVQLNPNGPRTPGEFAVYDFNRHVPVAIRVEGSIWELHARNWTEVRPRNWSQRLLVSAAAYHPGRRRVVLIGGKDPSSEWEPVRPVTMTWDGADLEFMRTVSVPTYRLAPLVVYDSKSDRLLTYGGLALQGGIQTGYSDGTARTETWSLRWIEN